MSGLLYGFTCSACWTTAEAFRAIADRDRPLLCRFCAGLNYAVPMLRERSTPALRGNTVARS